MTRPMTFLPALLLALLVPGGAVSAVEGQDPARVLTAEIRGPVTPVTVEYVAAAIERAATGRYSLLLIEMDTPGGLLASTEEIIQSILASRVPVAVFVTPAGAQAASAGLYISNAADVIAMSPGTRIGAGHPVSISPGAENKKEDGARDYMGEKVENDLAAGVRSIATQRGRNASVYERMVRESISLTEREAAEQKVADLVASGAVDLLEALQGRAITRFDGSQERLNTAGAPVDRFEMTLRQRILSVVANPNFAFIFLGVAAIGIYMEFSHPGLILPGAAGAVALVLFLMSVQLLPMTLLGLLLIALALTLFVLEIKFTSYGLLTVGGVVALTLGFLTLFDAEKMPGVRISLAFLLPTSLTIALVMGALTLLVVRAQRGRVVTGVEGLVGEIGEAATELGSALHPHGKVFVHGEYWNAESSRPISRGARVRVVEVRDMNIKVDAIDS